MALDLTKIRNQFPALHQQDIFLDNPGGTQVVKNCLDRMLDYLIESNANQNCVFRTSRESDELIAKSRAAMADFINASRPEEIIFGQNMTSLTFHLSRSLGRRLQPGDGIVVTRLDHDANITPWTIVAEERDCKIRWVDFHPEDGTLDLGSLEKALDGKPRLVAAGYASNALGTINPVAEIVHMAHQAGSLVFIDAVHYAPHGSIDVQKLGCDFLACSAYKFFGPHLGILYGRRELLEELVAYKVRTSSDSLPWRFETGTQNHEGIAGLLGTLEYLEWLGTHYGKEYSGELAKNYQGRVLHFRQALAAVRDYELGLNRAMLKILSEIPGLTVYGLMDIDRLTERVPTFAFRLDRWTPREVAVKLDQEGISVRDGNCYALEITKRLGIEETGGLVRAGAVHYNTQEEIEKFEKALVKAARS